MKFTGMTRHIDELGRIVVPKEIRQALNLQSGEVLKIYVEDNAIIFKKIENSCALCGGNSKLLEFNGKMICDCCLKKIKEI